MPKDIIEKTAIKICANVYEEACRLGIKQAPYKNEREFIRKNFMKYIPAAQKTLTEMLGKDYPDAVKQEIYTAILERANYNPKINGIPQYDETIFKRNPIMH